MSRGRRLLWLILVLVVAAALWPLPQDEISVAQRSERAAMPKTESRSEAAQLANPEPARGAAEADIIDLFPRQGLVMQAEQVASQKPVAPALPFVYGGRYTEGDKEIIFLKEGAKMHSVRKGETVNGTYRLDRIDKDSITLTYMPLSQEQVLQTGTPLRP